MSTLKLDLSYRAHETGDLPALNSAFLRGLRQSPYTWGLESDVFFPAARLCWERVLSGWNVDVAVPDGAATEIAGFIAWKPRLLAWVYAARAYRQMGVATALLGRAGFQRGVEFDVVFASPHRLSLFRDKGWRPRFVPFRAWELMAPAPAAEEAGPLSQLKPAAPGSLTAVNPRPFNIGAYDPQRDGPR